MDAKTLHSYQAQLEPLVQNDFQRRLLTASINNLANKENELRFNNFAYSIRELSRHVLEGLAADEQILKCNWYKNETDKPNGITRGQRIKYAIKGGLSDDYIEDLAFDIDYYKKPVVDAITLLSKYTHVNEKTLGISDSDVKLNCDLVVKAFSDFVNAIKICREKLIEELETNIDEAFIQHVINNSIDEIDILSTHHNIEEIEPTTVDIVDIDSRTISIAVNGIIHVRQQWGSDGDLKRGDGVEMNNSFPFNGSIRIEIDDKFPEGTPLIDTFEVDTEEWYD